MEYNRIKHFKNTKENREKLEKYGFKNQINYFDRKDKILTIDDEDLEKKEYHSDDAYEIMEVDEFIKEYCKPSLKKQLEELKEKINELDYAHYSEIKILAQKLNLEELE